MASKIEGLPIQKEWTVLKVKEGKEVPNPNGGGTLKAFFIDFEGAPDTYWRRKMPASVEVGKTYFGTISEGDHGPRFKKESPGGGSGGGGGGSRSGGREWKPESQYDPEKVARIGRSHAQGLAVEACKALGIFESKSGEQLDAALKRWTDYFEADVNRAAKAARGRPTATGQTATQTVSPIGDIEPPKTEAQAPEAEDPEWVLKVCEDAGLTSYPAGKLAHFIERLAPADQRRAVSGLRDFDTQGAVLAELKQSYEQHEGEPLPDSAPEDDIPF